MNLLLWSVGLSSLCSVLVPAANWPSWRGPNQDGTTPETRFATSWNDKAGVALVFDDLLADRRGTRRGFPPAVEENLLALWRYWNY